MIGYDEEGRVCEPVGQCELRLQHIPTFFLRLGDGVALGSTEIKPFLSSSHYISLTFYFQSIYRSP